MPLDQQTSARTIELSIIVPSFNERDNVEPLLRSLDAALGDTQWEAIFVDDDSPDGTPVKVREIARYDQRVRCLQRIGRRGLSTAIIEGMLASSAPYLAVLDADLQHDEKLLPRMLQTLKAEELDIVVASRYVPGGGVGDWDKSRAGISRFATRLSRLVVSAELTDPMSGFFLIARPAFERTVRRLSGQGFKILVDLFASTETPFRFRELPYVFRSRLHGESKLDSLAVWEYLMLLLDKTIGRFLPVRFILFSAIGSLGIFVHLTTLYLCLTAFAFGVSQAIATMVAMTSNFTLNNILTYRDRRLRGGKFITGLLSFYLICSIGALANVGIATAVFERKYTWWLSGLAGAAVGVVWNYGVSSVLTWRRH